MPRGMTTEAGAMIRADRRVMSCTFSSMTAAEVYARGLIRTGHRGVEIIDHVSRRSIKRVSGPY